MVTLELMVEISQTPQDGGFQLQVTEGGEVSRSLHWGSVQVAALGRYSGSREGGMRWEYAGRRRIEVFRSLRGMGGGGLLRTPQRAKDEVAAGGRFPGRHRSMLWKMGRMVVGVVGVVVVSMSPQDGSLHVVAE